MKRVAIIQARMGSSRLPGKVLKQVGGKPLLAHLVERLRQCRRLDDIWIATSDRQIDDPIEDWAKINQISVFRGDEHDVLSRFHGAAMASGADCVMRVTADCPLLDPSIVDAHVKLYEQGGYDYVWCGDPPNLPNGQSVEVFSITALQDAFNYAQSDYEHEHVTPYIRRPDKNYRIGEVKVSGIDPKTYRLCVDTEEDFQLANLLLSNMSGTSFQEIENLLSEHKEWAGINAHIEQTTGPHSKTV